MNTIMTDIRPEIKNLCEELGNKFFEMRGVERMDIIEQLKELEVWCDNNELTVCRLAGCGGMELMSVYFGSERVKVVCMTSTGDMVTSCFDFSELTKAMEKSK